MSEDEKYVLVLPLPPNFSNWRGHHMVKHRAKKKYYRDCFVQVYRTFGTILNEPRFEHIKLRARFFTHNAFDPDNLYGQLKFPLDMLRYFNVIPDDRKENVSFSSDDVTQQIDRKHKRLELTIWGSSTRTARPQSRKTDRPAPSAASPERDATTARDRGAAGSESTS